MWPHISGWKLRGLLITFLDNCYFSLRLYPWHTTNGNFLEVSSYIESATISINFSSCKAKIYWSLFCFGEFHPNSIFDVPRQYIVLSNVGCVIIPQGEITSVNITNPFRKLRTLKLLARGKRDVMKSELFFCFRALTSSLQYCGWFSLKWQAPVIHL